MAEKKKKSKKISKKKEKICEVFEIKKDGEEIVKEVCGTREVEQVSEGQIKKENKILGIILMILGTALIIFLVTHFIVQAPKTFEYKNMTFDIIDEGNVRFYHTSFPWEINKQKVTYNVYLRKDPRQNEKNVPFEGNLVITKAIVLNTEGDFNCEGNGVIAIANFNQIFTALGATIMNDPNATCDDQGRYNLITIKAGNETKIEEYSPRCYNLYVSNCEMLDVTERFITETLSLIEA